MLHVQKFLREKGHDALTEELGIKVNKHDTLPLVILNYDQIDSPKTNPIVRECRGLVLHADTHQVVARSFNRFFNWGEVQDEMDSFDFSDFSVQSKEDGSLVLIYNFDGKWRSNTRGSFAEDNMQFQKFTWTAGILQALGIDSFDDFHLAKEFTYVCEFCSPWNKIVRQYNQPVMYLLTAFDNATGEELTIEQCDGFARAGGMLRPDFYPFESMEEVQRFLQKQEQDDPTYEGVVIRDWQNHRWKIKSPTYLGLHRLRGNDDNIWNPKHLLPFVLSGEDDELLTYFPECNERFHEVKCKVLEAYIEMLEAWADNWPIEDQKEFALAVKDNKFSGVLFNARKKDGRVAEVRQEWRNSADAIHKKLFK